MHLITAQKAVLSTFKRVTCHYKYTLNNVLEEHPARHHHQYCNPSSLSLLFETNPQVTDTKTVSSHKERSAMLFRDYAGSI
jgi:hypothetical protein